MTDRLRIALAQLNPHLGAVSANVGRIRAARAEAASMGADLVVTPQFSLGGFPPEDLARTPGFLACCEAVLSALAAETADGGPGLVVGGPWLDGPHLRDAAVLLDAGRIVARRARHEASRHDGFDPGPAPGPVAFRDCRLGLMTGDDGMRPAVAETLFESGAELLLWSTASPFGPGEAERRMGHAVARVVETGLPLAAVAQVGGQDELVFGGGGFVLNADRSLALQQPMFAEAVTLTDWVRGGDGWACMPQSLPASLPPLEQTWRALTLGLADHVNKNGYSGVVLELSGDLGSTLSAACAVDALGAARVRAVAARSAMVWSDAAAGAALLGIRLDGNPANAVLLNLDAMPPGLEAGAAEGLRDRIGAAVLAAQADQRGDLPLSMASRSDLLLGCAAAGGAFSVLKDLWRSGLPDLARWRNTLRPAPAVPEPAIVAALRAAPPAGPEGVLPPYEVLDPILQGLVEENLHPDMLVQRGFGREIVSRVWRSLRRAEYKRRQASPGVLLGRHAFWRDRRFPLFHGFTDLVP
jgi:NAD+ synthase